MKITDLKLNLKNPRFIKDDKFELLKNSVSNFPKMMELIPIIIDENNIILAGNMRFRAIKELGYKEIPNEWIKKASELTEDEKKRFIITDNNSFGAWDMDMLANEWDLEELKEWGTDLPDFSNDNEFKGEENEDKIAEAHQKLTDKFIIPPFSILDTRQGYWQERKKYWRELIGDNGESREHKLANGSIMEALNNGVSLFDPVLSEIIVRWFGVEKCKIIDPFCGDTLKGYVFNYFGNYLTGIDIRKEQIDLNNNKKLSNCTYICDDGRNVLNHIAENSQDLLFSCPPYFDLEVYSDLKNDASNQKEYKDFLNILDIAFTNALKCLKENRFAVITVGDVRDKKGFYYRFVDDVKDIFKRNGVLLYNELILVESIGTLPQRVGRFMEYRKIGKCHQNVLVFFKGDPKKIKEIYSKLELNEIENLEQSEIN